MIGLFTSLVGSLSYGILLALIHFDQTESFGYHCNAHFEHLPQKEPIINIYAEKPVGHIAISGNDENRQVAIYTPIKNTKQIIDVTPEQKLVKIEYKRSLKKPKEVKFIEFKETDPFLSTCDDLQEPDVSQKHCIRDAMPEAFD